MAEFYSFEEALEQLQIDEEELKNLVKSGDLRGFRDGETMKFKQEDVNKLKKTRETEPTVILSDSDADVSIPEEEDQDLLLEEPSDDEAKDTVLNIDVFEDEGEQADTVDLDSIDIEDDTLSMDDDEEASITLIDDDDDEAGAATLVDVDTGDEDDSFDVIDDDDEDEGDDDDFEVVDTTITGSGRISRSARLRAMQIKKKKGHPIMTAILAVSAALLMITFAVLFNTVRGTEPEYLINLTDTFRGIFDSITAMFAG